MVWLGVWIVIGAVALLAWLQSVAAIRRFARHVREGIRQSADSFQPPVSVILPCRGLDEGLEDNVAALAHLNYPDCELILVIGSTDDRAYPALAAAASKRGPVPVRIVVAPPNGALADKINNQLAGVAAARPASEVLAFVDADMRPHPDFLLHLVAPLASGRVGATTGYRWHLPSPPTLPALLRSVWDGASLPFQLGARRSIAWGGAMAMRRDDFEALGVRRHWQQMISDDGGVTYAVRTADLDLPFVPRCLVPSQDQCTWQALWDWVRRQMIVIRAYHPGVWWGLAAKNLFASVIPIAGLATAALRWGTTTAFLAGGVAVAVPLLEMMHMALLLPSILLMMPQQAEQLRRLRWRYCLVMPLATWLASAAMLASALTRRLTWRNVTYLLVSRSRFEVVSAGRVEGARELG